LERQDGGGREGDRGREERGRREDDRREEGEENLFLLIKTTPTLAYLGVVLAFHSKKIGPLTVVDRSSAVLQQYSRQLYYSHI